MNKTSKLCVATTLA
ncbi:hypothetical protein, partial [Staphylococcus aureus]